MASGGRGTAAGGREKGSEHILLQEQNSGHNESWDYKRTYCNQPEQGFGNFNSFKGTVDFILSETSLFSEWHVRFTTLPCKPLSDNWQWRYKL